MHVRIDRSFYAPWGGHFEPSTNNIKEDMTMTMKLTKEQKDKNKANRDAKKPAKAEHGKKMLDALESNVDTKHVEKGKELVCCVCNKTIPEKSPYNILMADDTHPRRYRHVDCSPGSANWAKWLESQGKKTKIKPVFKDPVFKDKDGKVTKKPREHKEGGTVADRLIILLKTKKDGMTMAEIKAGMQSKSTFYDLCKKLIEGKKIKMVTDKGEDDKKDKKLFVAI